MPISADVLLDTSCALGLMDTDSVGHAAVMERTRSLVLGLSGHAYFETFSVLTRLPGDARRKAPIALRMIETNFPASSFLTPRESASALTDLAAVGIAGRSVYDGLVALAAVSARRLLLSRDRRAGATYRALGAEFDLI